MMNQLSLNAYHAEKKSGRLGRKRQMVYDIMKKYGDISNKSILIFAQLKDPSISINSITGRTRELVTMGMAEHKGTCKDPDTGHMIGLWGITGRTTPIELPKKVNKDKIIQKLKEENAELRAMIEEIK